MKIFKYSAFSAILLMSISGADAKDYNKGVAAYDAGDFKAALKEFLPLAEGGDANAQTYIGLMYDNGEGVIQNDVEAVKWYRLAADQGDADAQNSIGLMYEYGKGIIKNNVIAHMWYNIASSNGAENAAQRRDEIAAKMTREDISKAQAMAQECMSSDYKNCGD